MKRWLPIVLMISLPLLALAGVIAGVVWWQRREPGDPARELLRTALPHWQQIRAAAEVRANGTTTAAGAELVARARRWPAVAAALGALDRAWPDDAAVRAAVKAANDALAGAGLPYFVDVQEVGGRPLALTFDLVARARWRIGARTVEVLRLRRLDKLNVEYGLYGLTDGERPVVLLDRIESVLASDLPVMFGQTAESEAPMMRGRHNAFDRAALARLRPAFEARAGAAALAAAAAEMHERDRLLELMRGRLHDGTVQIDPPDGFVLGEEWLDSLAPETDVDRRGGPLILDTDLRAVVRADEPLRGGASAAALAAALDLMALATEAHEARHALCDVDPVGPPPPALFEVTGDRSTAFIAAADKEVRAYLGELADATAPACVPLAEMLRNLYGQGGGHRTPHFFATALILRELGVALDGTRAPAAILGELCDLPDANLRARVAATWQKLYEAPFVPGRRER